MGLSFAANARSARRVRVYGCVVVCVCVCVFAESDTRSTCNWLLGFDSCGKLEQVPAVDTND